MDTFAYELALFSDMGTLTTLLLPGTPDGYYRFGDPEADRFLSVEGINGQWVVCCSQTAYFKNVPPHMYQKVPVEDGQVLHVDDHDRSFIVFAEKHTREDRIFHNYLLQTEVEITIGAKPGNDIFCKSRYISGLHAVLSRSGSTWKIRDCESKNGVYVNNRRVLEADLCVGDVIYIMGLRIIIGIGFISVNSGAERAVISERIEKQVVHHHGGYSRYSGAEIPETGDLYFNRPPRKHIPEEERIIVVEGPPASMERTTMPLMLRMGSSMVMSGTAALAGNFTMLLTSLMFPFLGQRYTEKQRQEYEKRRVEKYTEYLERKGEEIAQACCEEQSVRQAKYPEINTVLEMGKDKVRLWERRPCDDDFMNLRVGHGQLPMSAQIDYPKQRFELEMDIMEEKMYQLVERDYLLNPMPIMNSFVEDYVCGVRGERNLVIDFVKQMLMQTAIAHSYDEVKIVVLASPKEIKQLEFVNYLPHTWDDEKNIRFVATNEAEAYRLGEYIRGEFPEDISRERNLEEAMKSRPYYIVFALDKKLFYGIEFFKTVLNTGVNHGLSVLAAFDDLPKECMKIFEMKPHGQNEISYLREDKSGQNVFSMDPFDEKLGSKDMKMMANLSLKGGTAGYELPKMVTFLEMFQAGRVEQLNPLKRWRENNPVKSLAAPVGVAQDGSLFELDLHEKRQGPHGLVAGMTGSGKSEFIITYILSMAINYHPDEVAFILIDYKGGGLAGAFENPDTGLHLPHLVGTITNLDGAAIQRSLMSIESELKRRQLVFNEVKRSTNEGTMDIYGYQKLYRAGVVSEPMPHLFIISDEFAELKQQEPEFMEKLISAARIGRSLGVHLILATQKPGGVVNDQIRSNTKFRVCLRVQDRSDSMDMLKRPEAAELKDTGRFYLQVGYNEFFALGQSAWCGAGYEPRDTVVSQKDDAIEFLDTTGQVLTKAKPRVKKVESTQKQIMAVVQYLSDLAKREGIEPKSLWTEPLPTTMSPEELHKRYQPKQGYPISALLGIVDDPERQSQYPFVLDIQNCQHFLTVGEAGSGKTTMMQSLLYTLTENYSPEQVNYCILDFSNKRLSPFRRMPHCCAYLTEEDEETYERFFTFISERIAERKRLFAQEDVSSFEGYVAKKPLPLMVVAMHNIAVFTGSRAGMQINLAEILRDSSSYGIKFVVTANFINEVTSKIRQEFGDRLAFRAKDKFAYGDIMNQKVTYLPKDAPGRGLCVIDERPLEFYSVITENGDVAKLRMALSAMQSRYQGQSAPEVLATLDETQEYADFAAKCKRGRIPLGYVVETVKPVMLPLKQFYSLSLYFGNPVGMRPVLENILSSCVKENMELVIVKQKKDSIFDEPMALGDRVTFLNSTVEDSDVLKERLLQAATERKALREQAYAQRSIDPAAPNAAELVADYVRENTQSFLVLFESFKDFATNVSETCDAIMQTIFIKGKHSNYYFIGCFQPGDAGAIGSLSLKKAFNPEELTMLFGGCLDRQGLISLPREYQHLSRVSERYNRCIMQYKGRMNAVMMPCGELIKSDLQDEDSAPIF